MAAKKEKIRRFELRNETTERFWEIGVNGGMLNIRFGKIGYPGQKTMVGYGDSYASNRHAEKLIRAKLKNGYLEVVDQLLNNELPPQEDLADQPLVFPPREIVKTDPIDPTAIGRHSLPGVNNDYRR